MDTLRISDADRARALDLLSEQYAVGRLDKDEFDERSDASRSTGPAHPGVQRRHPVVHAGGRSRWHP